MNDELAAVWTEGGRGKHQTPKDFSEFIAAVNAFSQKPTGGISRTLFRGVADGELHQLVPSLPRLKNSHPWLKGDRNRLYAIEHGVTREFMTRAHLYVDNVQCLPPSNPTTLPEYLHWWQLMQHHGVMTRVLDWTTSPNVALYFAAVHAPNADGAVYMVDRGAHLDRMRELHDGHFPASLESVQRPPTRFQEAQEKHMSTCLDFFPCGKPNERMSAQRGWFSYATIIDVDHGEAIAQAFDQCKGPDKRGIWTRKVIIKKEFKSHILRDLWRMSVTGETLFPGLDGLGRAMAELPSVLQPDEHGTEFHLADGLLASVDTMTPSLGVIEIDDRGPLEVTFRSPDEPPVVCTLDQNRPIRLGRGGFNLRLKPPLVDSKFRLSSPSESRPVRKHLENAFAGCRMVVGNDGHDVAVGSVCEQSAPIADVPAPSDRAVGESAKAEPASGVPRSPVRVPRARRSRKE